MEMEVKAADAAADEGHPAVSARCDLTRFNTTFSFSFSFSI